jgi:hypothetical protein
VEVPEINIAAPRRSSLVWMIAALVMLGILGALAPVLLKRMLARTRRNAPTPQP